MHAVQSLKQKKKGGGGTNHAAVEATPNRPSTSKTMSSLQRRLEGFPNGVGGGGKGTKGLRFGLLVVSDRSSE